MLCIIGSATTLLGCVKKPLPPGESVIDSVRVVGADKVDESALRQRIATARSPRFAGLFQGVVFEYELLDEAEVARDAQRIERVYRSEGYYDARVTEVRILRVAPGHVDVEFIVWEGEPVRVRRTDLRGIERLGLEAAFRVLQLIDLQPGDLLSDTELTASSEFIRRQLADLGHAWARVDYRVHVHRAEHRADVTFTIESGPVAAFGEVTFVGAGTVPGEDLIAAAAIAPGDLYAESEIFDAQRRLARLAIFASIDVQPDLSSPESRKVPVTIRVEEGDTRTVFLGGGFALDTRRFSVHANVGWEVRNFIGSIRRLTLNARPGLVLFPTRIPSGGDSLASPTDLLPEVRSNAEYLQPILRDLRTQLELRAGFGVTAFLIDEHVEQDAQVLGFREPTGSIGVTRPFFGDVVELGTSFNGRAELPFAYKGAVPDVLRSLTFWFWAADLRIGRPRTHRVPQALTGRVEVADFGGQVADSKLESQLVLSQRLSSWGLFASRAKFGVLFPRNYTEPRLELPVDDPATVRSQQILQFRGLFSGGPNSNRGYPYHGVGPHGRLAFLTPQSVCAVEDTDPQCFRPLGGFTLWESTLELQFDLYEPSPDKLYRFVVFTDASDVGYEFRLDRPHLSLGIGLSIHTDVGPLRLDVGYRVPGLQVLGKTDLSLEEGRQESVFGLPATFNLFLGDAF